MVKKDVVYDVVTLVKVFDVNYVTNEDSEKLCGLDINEERGVREAVRRLLLPEFLGYTEAAQARLLNSLQSSLADLEEDFSYLFDRIEFAFDEPIREKRHFMQALLRSIEFPDGQ